MRFCAFNTYSLASIFHINKIESKIPYLFQSCILNKYSHFWTCSTPLTKNYCVRWINCVLGGRSFSFYNLNRSLSVLQIVKPLSHLEHLKRQNKYWDVQVMQTLSTAIIKQKSFMQGQKYYLQNTDDIRIKLKERLGEIIEVCNF